MGKRTALYQSHLACSAKMVDFNGWDMPLHYGSQLQEHHRVRSDVAMFDVSHMLITDIAGPGCLVFLQHLLTNDCSRLHAGQGLYSCMLNETGGVLDDLIVYRVAAENWRMVSNAGTRTQVSAWLQQHGGDDVSLWPREDLAIIAVQGPAARGRCLSLLPATLRERAAGLPAFHACQEQELFVARTGYTGEDGFELILPAIDVVGFWQLLLESGIAPAGLGARDSLRLEAGMNLYGQDMDAETTPLEAGLAWTVAWQPEGRDFIGRQALQGQRVMGVRQRQTGVILEGRGVLRNGQEIVDAYARIGKLTSGGFSPSLGRAIGLARVPVDMEAQAEVVIRGRHLPLRLVSPPFIRMGTSCIEGLDIAVAHSGIRE